MDIQNKVLASKYHALLSKNVKKTNGLQKPAKTTSTKDSQGFKIGGKDVKVATDQFEEFFVHSLMKEMRKTQYKDQLLHGGQGEDLFRDMLDGQYTKLMVKNGGIGLSQFMIDQLKNH
ncbi:MAG: Rod binding domain-containing protein [bacterium]|jgi:Rod binding domain-containing protein